MRASDRNALTAPPALCEEIPHGLETRVLRRAGILRWEQLCSPRRLRVLAAHRSGSNGCACRQRCGDRLRLSLAGCAEMAGHVSRWDRFYLKAFEATANRRFAITGFSYGRVLLTRGVVAASHGGYDTRCVRRA